MWANAQRDGRPAKYRWRPSRKFFNSIPCTTPQSFAVARCWSAVQSRCQYRRTQDLDVKSVLHRALFCRGKSSRQCIYNVPAQEMAKHRAKFGWPPERRRCSNESKTRNLLKFAGVPQTRQRISDVNGPLFNKFLSDCRYMP